MASLPESIITIAYRATNGELAWRRVDMLAVLSGIAASGQAVLGGEVWIALGDGRWHGLIPDLHGGPPSVWHWETASRSAGEAWPAYCGRAAEESAGVVGRMRVEEASPPEVRPRLFFSLTYVTEVEAEPGTESSGGACCPSRCRRSRGSAAGDSG